jgi:hypothetical protein
MNSSSNSKIAIIEKFNSNDLFSNTHRFESEPIIENKAI